MVACSNRTANLTRTCPQDSHMAKGRLAPAPIEFVFATDTVLPHEEWSPNVARDMDELVPREMPEDTRRALYLLLTAPVEQIFVLERP